MRLHIDFERCTGHGRCYAIAPKFLEPDDEGRPQFVDGDDVPPRQADEVRTAVRNCPEQALRLED